MKIYLFILNFLIHFKNFFKDNMKVKNRINKDPN